VMMELLLEKLVLDILRQMTLQALTLLLKLARLNCKISETQCGDDEYDD